MLHLIATVSTNAPFNWSVLQFTFKKYHAKHLRQILFLPVLFSCINLVLYSQIGPWVSYCTGGLCDDYLMLLFLQELGDNKQIESANIDLLQFKAYSFIYSWVVTGHLCIIQLCQYEDCSKRMSAESSSYLNLSDWDLNNRKLTKTWPLYVHICLYITV